MRRDNFLQPCFVLSDWKSAFGLGRWKRIGAQADILYLLCTMISRSDW